MQCRGCGEDKLHHEFPAEGPTARCSHIPTWCLACVKRAWSVNRLGPIRGSCPECSAGASGEEMRTVTTALQCLECPVFRDLDAIQDSKAKTVEQKQLIPPSGSVEVVLLDGQRCSVELSRDTTLGQLKQNVSKHLGVPVGQQRLMHGGKELKGEDLAWRDAGVQYGSVLQLVVILYVAGVGSGGQSSGAVRALTFDLSWTGLLNTTRTGHLNGSCIVLDDSKCFLYSVDFQHLHWQSIQHHGPSSKHSARQKITVSLDCLGGGAAYLFFTLSAFAPGGITMLNFQNPRVELLDSNTAKTLATYTAAQATDGEAVVLCCAKRQVGSGIWIVQQIGTTSSGNVKQPEALIESIQRIAGSGRLL